MQVIKNYPISEEDLFKAIRRLFKNDYIKHSKEDLLEGEIKSGLEYTMFFGENLENKSNVLLKTYEEPKIYETEITSNRGKVHVRYELKSNQANETEITYIEHFETSGMFSKLNYQLVSFFMKKRLKERMEQALDHLYKVAIQLKEKGEK